jgi:adenosylhomocysteinase
MKDGAICCNAGHFDIEVDVAWLRANAVKTFEARHNIMGYTLKNGRTVYVLAEGRLVNLAAGDGHPAEIMDMSFAIQALSAAYLAQNKDSLTEKLISVPREIDMRVAELLLGFMGLSIDTLTDIQKEYLSS